MPKIKHVVRGSKEVLMEIFQMCSLAMAISVVLLVEAWGISKVWHIVTGP